MKLNTCKVGLIILSLCAISAQAATVNYSTTTVGNRVVTTTTPLTPVLAGSAVIMGTLSDETNFATFAEFGRTTINSNAAFTNGVINGGATNNTATASNFAGKNIYIAVYDNASGVGATFGGIFKSTTLYDTTISSSASQVFGVDINTFTTSIRPAVGWAYEAATVNPAGTTGAAGNPPTDRTGIVFTLAPVPEAGSSMLAMLGIGALLGFRRRLS